MKIIDYNVNYYSESYFGIVLLILMALSFYILAFLIIKACDEYNDNDKYGIKALLSFGIFSLLLVNYFTLYYFTKKPYLSIKYIHNNIGQKIIKSQN